MIWWWKAQLRSHDYRIRNQVVKKLAGSRRRSGFRTLAAVLLDPTYSEDVREEIAAAMAAFGERAVDPLLAVLSDKNYRVRYRAAKSLGEIGGLRAVMCLAEVLKSDTDSLVRWTAICALAKLRDVTGASAFAHALGDEREEIRLAAVKALREFCPLSPELSAEVNKVQSEIADIHLVHWLESKDARSWIRFRSGNWTEKNLSYLLDCHWPMKRDAVEAGLERLRLEVIPEIIYEWIAYLTKKIEPEWAHPDDYLPTNSSDLKDRYEGRERLARELEGYGGGKIPHLAVPYLLEALKHEDYVVSLFVAELLGKIRDPRAVTALSEALNDTKHDVREAARCALSRFDSALSSKC